LYFENIVRDISEEDIDNLEGGVGSQLNLHPAGSNPQWLPAIACTEGVNSLYGKSLAQLKPRIANIESQSYIAGEIWASKGMGCTGWSIAGKGRFTGL
jgi:hypothetical protein